MLIAAEDSTLLVVDIQERLLPAVVEPDTVLRNAAILMTAAGRLDVPVVISEQYPAGIGPTVAPLRHLVPPGSVVEKISFSCHGEPAFDARLDGLKRKQAVILGLEAHVCVMQTALDLQRSGVAVFAVADAMSSRDPRNHALAVERMRAGGVTIVSTEMVVFEWLRRAGTDLFRELLALIK